MISRRRRCWGHHFCTAFFPPQSSVGNVVYSVNRCDNSVANKRNVFFVFFFSFLLFSEWEHFHSFWRQIIIQRTHTHCVRSFLNRHRLCRRSGVTHSKDFKTCRQKPRQGVECIKSSRILNWTSPTRNRCVVNYEPYNTIWLGFNNDINAE